MARPAAVGGDPLGPGGSWRRQGKIEETNPLAFSAAAAKCNDLKFVEIDALDDDLLSEQPRRERQRQVLPEHGEETGRLLPFIVCVDDRLLYEAIEFAVIRPGF